MDTILIDYGMKNATMIVLHALICSLTEKFQSYNCLCSHFDINLCMDVDKNQSHNYISYYLAKVYNITAIIYFTSMQIFLNLYVFSEINDLVQLNDLTLMLLHILINMYRHLIKVHYPMITLNAKYFTIIICVYMYLIILVFLTAGQVIFRQYCCSICTLKSELMYTPCDLRCVDTERVNWRFCSQLSWLKVISSFVNNNSGNLIGEILTYTGYTCCLVIVKYMITWYSSVSHYAADAIGTCCETFCSNDLYVVLPNDFLSWIYFINCIIHVLWEATRKLFNTFHIALINWKLPFAAIDLIPICYLFKYTMFDHCILLLRGCSVIVVNMNSGFLPRNSIHLTKFLQSDKVLYCLTEHCISTSVTMLIFNYYTIYCLCRLNLFALLMPCTAFCLVLMLFTDITIHDSWYIYMNNSITIHKFNLCSLQDIPCILNEPDNLLKYFMFTYPATLLMTCTVLHVFLPHFSNWLIHDGG